MEQAARLIAKPRPDGERTAINASNRRWTSASIRKATPFPKPRGAIDKLFERPALNPMPAEVAFILRVLAEADVLDVTTRNAIGVPTRWLLVPVGEAELEFLGSFGSRHDDLEDDERELNHDDEPELGATEELNQEDSWSNTGPADGDNDQIDEHSAVKLIWAPDWRPDLFPSGG